MTQMNRRALLGLFAGAAAAPVVAKVDLFAGTAPAALAEPVAARLSLSEIIATTQRAFIPRLTVQVYKESPLLAWAKAGCAEA